MGIYIALTGAVSEELLTGKTLASLALSDQYRRTQHGLTKLLGENMSLTLRDPEQIDYQAIASWIGNAKACARWAGPQVPFPFEAHKLPELLAVPGGRSYCLSASGEACIGFGQFWTAEQSAVHIGRLIISPHERRTGVGRLLCEQLISEAVRQTGAPVVTLRVYRDNIVAHALYLSLGFSTVESKSTDDLLFMSSVSNKPGKVQS